MVIVNHSGGSNLIPLNKTYKRFWLWRQISGKKYHFTRGNYTGLSPSKHGRIKCTTYRVLATTNTKGRHPNNFIRPKDEIYCGRYTKVCVVAMFITEGTNNVNSSRVPLCFPRIYGRPQHVWLDVLRYSTYAIAIYAQNLLSLRKSLNPRRKTIWRRAWIQFCYETKANSITKIESHWNVGGLNKRKNIDKERTSNYIKLFSFSNALRKQRINLTMF